MQQSIRQWKRSSTSCAPTNDNGCVHYNTPPSVKRVNDNYEVRRFGQRTRHPERVTIGDCWGMGDEWPVGMERDVDEGVVVGEGEVGGDGDTNDWVVASR